MVHRLTYNITMLPLDMSDRSAYSTIEQWFNITAALRAPWIGYAGTLLNADNEIRSTIRPANFFNINGLGKTTGQFRVFQSLPGYFVGLGLIFTFLGLVAGLHFASEGIATPSLEDARQALVQLLNASTFKFLTSISGIATSLILSLSSLLAGQALQNSLADVSTALERIFPLITEQAVLYERLSGPEAIERAGEPLAPRYPAEVKRVR